MGANDAVFAMGSPSLADYKLDGLDTPMARYNGAGGARPKPTEAATMALTGCSGTCFNCSGRYLSSILAED